MMWRIDNELLAREEHWTSGDGAGTHGHLAQDEGAVGAWDLELFVFGPGSVKIRCD